MTHRFASLTRFIARRKRRLGAAALVLLAFELFAAIAAAVVIHDRSAARGDGATHDRGISVQIGVSPRFSMLQPSMF